MDSFINIITLVCFAITLQEVTSQYYYVQSHQPPVFQYPTFRSSPQTYTSTFHGNPNYRYQQNFVQQPAQHLSAINHKFRGYEPQAPAATRHIQYPVEIMRQNNIFTIQNQVIQPAPPVARNMIEQNSEYRGFAYRTQTNTGATSHVLFVSGPQSQQIRSQMFANPSPVEREFNQARNIASNMVDSLASTTEMPLSNVKTLPKSIQDLYKLPETNPSNEVFQQFFENPQPRLVNFYSTDSNLFVDPIQNYPASTAPLPPNENPSNLLNILRSGATHLQQQQTNINVTDNNNDSTSVEAQESVITRTRFRINDINNQDKLLSGKVTTDKSKLQSTTELSNSGEIEETIPEMKIELLKIKNKPIAIQMQPEPIQNQQEIVMPLSESKEATMLKSEEKSMLDSQVKAMLESQEKSMLVFQGRFANLNLLKLNDDSVDLEVEPLSELKQDSMANNNENDKSELVDESKEELMLISQESMQASQEKSAVLKESSSEIQEKSSEKEKINLEVKESFESETEPIELSSEKEEINSEINESFESVTEPTEVSSEKEEINSEISESSESEQKESLSEMEEANSEIEDSLQLETNSEVEKSEDAILALKTVDLQEEQMSEVTTESASSTAASKVTSNAVDEKATSTPKPEISTSQVDITNEYSVTTDAMTSTTMLPTTKNDTTETTTVVPTTQGFLIVVDDAMTPRDAPAKTTLTENITTENVIDSTETTPAKGNSNTIAAENVTTEVSSYETTEDFTETDSTTVKQ